jgi:hypothetical protein
MSFEEAANPIIDKFIDEIINNWQNEVKGRFGKLENEVIELINQHKENLISILREKLEQINKSSIVEKDQISQLVLALGKLIPAPLPPEQSMIVKAQKVWNELELASSQAEALGILLNKVAMNCDGAALFILRGNNVVGWKSLNLSTEGFSDANIGQVSFEFADSIAFYHCFQTYSYISYSPGYFMQDSFMLEKLGNRKVNNINIFPLIVKGKCVAFLYCDSKEEPLDVETIAFIDLLTNLTALAIETLPTRQAIINQKKALTAKRLEQSVPKEEIRREVEGERKVEAKVEEIKKEVKESAAAPAEVAEKIEEIKAEIKEAVAPAAAPAISEEEMKLHEEAKRFARLLVSEIKLYNEAQVALGRENKDLFERLKDDIERSKKMYLERVSPKIAATTNYFYEELVRTLAGGDPSALGTDSI